MVVVKVDHQLDVQVQLLLGVNQLLDTKQEIKRKLLINISLEEETLASLRRVA
jgi:hypothetical protein